MSVDYHYEWDEAKANTNRVKHGVNFLTAVAIFDREFIELVDDREDYGEQRLIAIGLAGTEVYRVVYTPRGPLRRRIISAQKATTYEREIYYGHVFG